MYRDIGGYFMKYNEFKEMCCNSGIEKFNFLCIDMARIRKIGNYRIFNESKNTYNESIPESEAL